MTEVQRLKCMIVDDEPLAVEGIASFIEKFDFLSLEATAFSAIEAGEVLKHHYVDLLFLDINMPYLTGLEFLESLEQAPLTIFTTAYSEYAIDGYRLQVVDYLLKPFSLARFTQAVQRAYELWHYMQQKPSVKDEGFIYIRQMDSFLKLRIDEIICVEAMQNYLKIHTITGKYTIHQTMQTIENDLPSDIFFRTHRSYLVNLNRINSITSNEILIGDLTLPLSRYRRKELFEKAIIQKLISK